VRDQEVTADHPTSASAAARLRPDGWGEPILPLAPAISAGRLSPRSDAFPCERDGERGAWIREVIRSWANRPDARPV